MRKAHCLFEQSGSFRDMFRANGHDALCYDIANDYGKTDRQIDLFEEIKRGEFFEGLDKDKDFIFAFFPCTYFSGQNELIFTARQVQDKPKRQGNNIDPNLILDVRFRAKERCRHFDLFLQFCQLVDLYKIPTIIENPHCKGLSYIYRYSPYRPSYHEKDRTVFGDSLVKPTDYYAINFEMQEKLQMFYDKNYFPKQVVHLPKKQRSEISVIYAQNFYDRFLRGKI